MLYAGLDLSRRNEKAGCAPTERALRLYEWRGGPTDQLRATERPLTITCRLYVQPVVHH
jgi:hypothetical protein